MGVRADLDDYFGDVTYRVWLSGGNPDMVDLDRVGESHWQGDDPDACADSELRHKRKDLADDQYGIPCGA